MNRKLELFIKILDNERPIRINKKNDVQRTSNGLLLFIVVVRGIIFLFPVQNNISEH